MSDAQKLTNAEQLTLEKIADVRIILRQEKPGDRSDVDRRYAILLTEIDKLEALYRGFIIHGEEIINE